MCGVVIGNREINSQVHQTALRILLHSHKGSLGRSITGVAHRNCSGEAGNGETQGSREVRGSGLSTNSTLSGNETTGFKRKLKAELFCPVVLYWV
jgi:hypothetical protein